MKPKKLKYKTVINFMSMKNWKFNWETVRNFMSHTGNGYWKMFFG